MGQRPAAARRLSWPPADIYIIAVPTPFRDGHHADLSYIEAAADGIIPHLRGGELIILESTSPPGTTQHLADRITAARPELTTHDPDAKRNVDVAHYATFCQGEIFLTNAITAEMAKLTENSFREVNIASANELSIIAESLGIDVFELIELANKHTRGNPAAGDGRRRALHRGRPVVHRLRRPRAVPADPHGARGERRQAGVCGQPDP